MRVIRYLYLTKQFYISVTAVIILFVFSYFIGWLYPITLIILYLIVGVTVLDAVILFRKNKGIIGHRFIGEKLSNGDENPVRIYLENLFPFEIKLNVIDEIPHQFQRRDILFELKISSLKTHTIHYTLRPVKRGQYHFGAVNVMARSPLNFVIRRFSFSYDVTLPVYPSFIQMRKYELMAISNRLTELGIKKVRRLGHQMEFEQIKEYVQGDDVRTINWKATARKGELMVNNFQDEKSQQVYCLIDKGRVMQMPFNGMTLLDYAINASLVISNIAIRKEDKAGIITFQHKIGNVLPAAKLNNQMFRIQELLYNQKTAFKETDFSRLYALVKTKIRQRSLLLVFTNFESRVSLDRQLPYLKSLSKSHVVVVIFFENIELAELLNSKPTTVKEIFHKAVGEKFVFEKHLIVKELKRNGIYSILSKPEELTVNTINKYLELKSRGIL